MLVSPLGWQAVLYCGASILVGLLAILSGVLGLFVLPLVTWATANAERYRLRLPTPQPFSELDRDTGGPGLDAHILA